MADFLANPIDICFDSTLVESTAPIASFVIENTATTSFEQVESDLLTQTHPLTPRDLIKGLNCVESMLCDTIKVCESIKRPSRTTTAPPCMSLGLRNSARVASNHMKKKIQTQSRSTITSCGVHRSPLNDPCHIHKKAKDTARQRCMLNKLH